jgi:uncharacterized 2Fe-2S/4Fe-4S cluster protein (DUF4445 family)
MRILRTVPTNMSVAPLTDLCNEERTTSDIEIILTDSRDLHDTVEWACLRHDTILSLYAPGKGIAMEIRLTTGKSVPLEKGQSILDALKVSEIYLTASCGGKGTCGKCKVRVIEGDGGAVGQGKLTAEEQRGGLILACRSYPQGNVTLEIPEGSRLVVGEKIAVARAGDLATLLGSLGADIKPVLATVTLHLSPPTLHDNVSDVERLKLAMEEQGVSGIHFSHGFALSMAEALRTAGWKVTLGYTDGPEAVFISPEGEERRYGLAVDIGTTTVVAYLVDLKDGKLLDVGLTYNSQMRWGDDVITRIVHATEGNGLEELREAIVTDINDLIGAMAERHEIPYHFIESLTVSGNTTMTHLFWGLNPGYIREEPYIPTLNVFPMWHGGSARLNANPQAPVYTLPCVASYVGGDIVSGVLASGMHKSEDISLFMDIGTNGEIAFGNKEWLVTAAASAGPCFEGSGIRHGMRATEGAVEEVKIRPGADAPDIKTIGDIKPIGICGSGMIDAIAEMLLAGIIDQKGNFVEQKSERIRQCADGLEYVISGDAESVVTLTQADIENILRAKAAIYAGVTLLVTEVGFSLKDIQKVYIAGGFGTYLDVERAIILGMIPDLPLERFSFHGNTSAAGAYLCLLSEDMRREAEEIASKMTYIELSASRGFMDEYMSAMFLPHTDASQFPSVGKLLSERT